MRMFRLLLVLAGFAVADTEAQTVAATPPVGYFKLTAQGGSDTVLSLPLVKRSAAMGQVSAIASNTVTLQLAAAATDGAFAASSGSTYYAQFVTGKLAGLTYRVVNNTAAGVFTLDTGGDDLTSHVLGTVAVGTSGDIVRIRPYWTLTDVFGTGSALVLDPVTGPPTDTYVAGDQVLFFDNASSGTDKKLSPAFAYVTGAGWRQRADAATDAGITPLSPGVPFVVRRQNAAAAGLTIIGYVSTDRLLVALPAVVADEDRDVAVAPASPAQPTLGTSNLVAAAPFGAMEISTNALTLRDLVLEYTAEHRGFAIPAAHRYTFTGTDWFEDDANVDGHVLQPGAGYILRLRGARSARYWQQPSSP